MYTVSRYIIFVPVVIFILALYIHYSSPKQSSINSTTIPSVQPKQNGLDTVKTKSASSNNKLDLKGPYKCQYKTNDMDISAYILNRKVYVELTQNKKTDYILLNGDCGYKWVKGENKGEKMCGVGTYVSMIESFSSMPFFNINSMFSMVGQFSPSMNLEPAQLAQVAESCKKETVEDMVFTIPTTIIFSDIQKISPPVSQ